MRQELQALNTIEVIDDREESTEKFHFDKTEHSRSVQSVPDINTSSCTDVNYQTPSCSQFTSSFTSSDKSDSNVITSTSETIHNTECTYTSDTIHNTDCTYTSETIHNTECTSTSETIHNTECTSTSETIHNTKCTSTSETIHNTECTSTSETIHNTKCTSTSETIHNTKCTSTSETIHNTKCTSTSETIHNTECTSTSETIHNTECTSTSETIHNTECTGSDVTDKEKLPTVSSNQELYDKSDKISRPSYWLPKTVPEKEKEQEIDDFEYLGNLDDGYLLSLFEEEEEDKIPSCIDVETISEVNNTVTVNQVVEQAGSSNTATPGQKLIEFSTDELEFTSLTLNDTTTSTSEVNNSRRYNPPRRAKDGVEYCENNDYLEDVLQSEYCKFWQNDDFAFSIQLINRFIGGILSFYHVMTHATNTYVFFSLLAV